MLPSAKKLFVFCIFCIIMYFSYRAISANFEEDCLRLGEINLLHILKTGPLLKRSKLRLYYFLFKGS